MTGASAGIGYETARQLAVSGMTVVGCARNTATIEVCQLARAIISLHLCVFAGSVGRAGRQWKREGGGRKV